MPLHPDVHLKRFRNAHTRFSEFAWRRPNHNLRNDLTLFIIYISIRHEIQSRLIFTEISYVNDLL